MRERETRAAFCLVLNLARFETLERERGFAFDLAIKDLRGRRHHRRTTSTPPSYPRGPVLRRSPAASVTDSNAPFPREVQQNMSNLVAQLPLSSATSTQTHRPARLGYRVVLVRDVRDRSKGADLAIAFPSACWGFASA